MCLVQVTEVTNYLTILTNFLSLKLLGGVLHPPTHPGSDVPGYNYTGCVLITSSEGSILQEHLAKYYPIFQNILINDVITDF